MDGRLPAFDVSAKIEDLSLYSLDIVEFEHKRLHLDASSDNMAIQVLQPNSLLGHFLNQPGIVIVLSIVHIDIIECFVVDSQTLSPILLQVV